ncbi:MAG: bacterioferritin [Myxococcota bacterium]
MKGSPVVIDLLNELLVADLTASDLYLYCARELSDRGYHRLAAMFQHESEHEREHAEKQADRIIFLEGQPELAKRMPVTYPEGAEAMLRMSLDYEVDVAKKLRTAITTCDAEGDPGTRMLLETLLRETEEDHILWLEAELDVIGDIGVPLYLSKQMGAKPAPA